MRIKIHYENAWLWVKDHQFSSFVGGNFGKSTPLFLDDAKLMTRRQLDGSNINGR